MNGMRRHPIIAIFLTLVLAVTGQSMAVARGASAATGQMVLCTGSGPLAIYVDAQGNLTSAPHICPDCALNILFEGPLVLLAIPTRLMVFRTAPLKTAAAVMVARKQRPSPREPPVPV